MDNDKVFNRVGVSERDENKKRKRDLYIGLLVLFFLIWGLFNFFFGFYFISNNNEKVSRILPNSLQKIAKINYDIREQPVYIHQASEARYIDENTDEKIFNELLTASKDHFDFEYFVEDEENLKEIEDFILVNIENQHARLATKFDLDLDKKINIKLVDDFKKFQEDMNVIIEGQPDLIAFSENGETIEMFIPSSKPTIDKFILASTISHELVHIYQYHKYIYLFFDDENLIWLYEGMAEHWAYPKEDSIVLPDMSEEIPNLKALNAKLESGNQDNLETGYAVAEQFFSYLQGKYGEDKMHEIFDESLRDFMWRRSFNEAFKRYTDITPETAFQEWSASFITAE